MSGVPCHPMMTPSQRVVNSEDDIISGDIIDVKFPHVRALSRNLVKLVFFGRGRVAQF